MKRKISILVLLALLMTCLLPVYAAEDEDVSGEGDGAGCGAHLGWYFEEGTLTVFGEGEMYDFDNGAPWADFRDEITKVVLKDGVTTVGAHAFEDYDRLTSVDFGDALTRIGASAFAGCDGLTSISLPKTFKKFGEKCFYSCRKLTEIHCAGSFPRFDENCLWDTWCKIYFPASAPWSVIYIEQLETAFQGRIEFLASDGSDPYTPTETTEETEAPTTQAPVETTQAPTTVPAEAPSTAPVTQQTEQETAQEETAGDTRETILFGAASETTAPETQPARGSGGGMIGLAIVVCTLSLIGIAALAFRAANRRY